MPDYDLVIIGAGWAGFSAAIEARKFGLKVALIEKDKIGGTCLNYGCIPTKALIHSVRILSLAKRATHFGIQLENPNFNFAQVLTRKKEVIESLHNGMQFLIKTKQINYIHGQARFINPNQISIDSSRNISARHILIATGSKPTELNSLKFDSKRVITSNQILDLESLPESLLIVGGGVIGCEFAQLFSNLGCKVTVVELMPQLLPNEDKEVAQKLELIFKKTNITVLTKTDVTGVNLNAFDKILVCIGRTPDTDNLGLEQLGLNTNKNKIVVDEFLKTNLPNIFAAGDCIGGLMLAHVASYEARLAVNNIASEFTQKVDYRAVPNSIFTEPQIASIGLNIDEAKKLGYETKINKFSFLSSGMARILDQTEGFIKIISDKNTEEILGAVIFGPEGTELVNIISLAMHAHLKLKDISGTIFGHPSISESITEAVRDS